MAPRRAALEPHEKTPRLFLPRVTRVVRAADFERAWKQGSRARGDALLVVAAPNGLELARLGLSVGKKAFPRAVDRNRVRRLYRETFRLTRRQLPAGFDFVLVPAVSRTQPSLAALLRELPRLANKAAARSRERAQTPPAP